MRAAGIIISLSLLVGCEMTDNGIVIDTPDVPSINICEHVATDDEVTVMKSKIEAQAFKDERMERARYVTDGYCFVATQVVDIMESMIFEDARLEIAKDLYEQTLDKENYDIVVDALVYKSDRDELKTYINQHH